MWETKWGSWKQAYWGGPAPSYASLHRCWKWTGYGCGLVSLWQELVWSSLPLSHFRTWVLSWMKILKFSFRVPAHQWWQNCFFWNFFEQKCPPGSWVRLRLLLVPRWGSKCGTAATFPWFSLPICCKDVEWLKAILKLNTLGIWLVASLVSHV